MAFLILGKVKYWDFSFLYINDSRATGDESGMPLRRNKVTAVRVEAIYPIYRLSL